MLDILRKLAGKPASAADLRKALTELEDAGARAETGLAEARAAKRAGILEGDEKAISRADAAITVAERDLDRIEIGSADVARRLAEAEAMEADAALDSELEDVRREAEVVKKILTSEYVRATKTVVTTLRRLGDVEERIAALNARLAAAGRHGEALPGIEETTWPALPGLINTRAADVTRLKSYTDARGEPIPGTPSGWPAREG